MASEGCSVALEFSSHSGSGHMWLSVSAIVNNCLLTVLLDWLYYIKTLAGADRLSSLLELPKKCVSSTMSEIENLHCILILAVATYHHLIQGVLEASLQQISKLRLCLDSQLFTT